MRRPDKWVVEKFESMAVRAVLKFVPYSTGSQALFIDAPEPPYQRRFDPRWVYNIRENHALINNAIEKKVSQTLRRGFDDWEQKYEAKCPHCKKEFSDETKFRQQYGDIIPDDKELDFDSARVCPNCGEKVHFHTPNPLVRDRADDFFSLANGRDLGADHLEPAPEAGVGQTLVDVLKEVSWDIESFDDGWLIFERDYLCDEQGHITDYELRNIHRAPPELMRFSIDPDTGNFGGQYWVCVKCRATDEHYVPENQPQQCSDCGGKTYEVFAYATSHAVGHEPEHFYIRGEFVHASQYEPSKYYGYPPIISLYDEARAIEKMDEWYREAYEQRRAPRGALVIRSSNADATRTWNRGQLEKLNNDSNHIPTLMDDTDGGGSEPIKWVELMPTPAEMQQMEMREWIKERISAKWGVTQILMSGAPNESGLSQSMEIQVSNRASERLRTILNEIFIPAILGQLGVEGWERDIARVEEEDEHARAEKVQRELQIAQQASQLGLSVEWQRDDTAEVRAGPVEAPEDGMGGLGGMLGGDGPGPGPTPSGPGEREGQTQLGGIATEGGAPRQDPRPAEDESAFGRMAKTLRAGHDIEVFNEWTGEWESAEKIGENENEVIARTESNIRFAITDDGAIRAIA